MTKSRTETPLSANIKYVALQGIYWSGFCAVFNFAAIFLLGKGFTNGEAGMILAASSVGAVLFQSVLASAADRSKRVSLRSMTACVCAAVAVFSAGLAAVGDSRLLAGGIFLVVMMLMLSIQTLLNSLVMEYINSGIDVNFGATRAAGSLSFAVTSFLLGKAVAAEGIGMIPYVYIALFSAAALFVLLLQNRKRPTGAKENRVPVPGDGAASIDIEGMADMADMPDISDMSDMPAGNDAGFLAFAARYKRFMLLIVGATMIFTCYNMCSNYMIRIVEPLGGGSAEVGTVFAIGAFLELPAMIAFGFLTRTFGCSRLFKIAALFLTVKALGICMAGSISGIYAIQIVQTVSYALFIPASVYYVDKVMALRDKVKGQSLMVATSTLGGVFGSLLGSWLLDLTGLRTMLWISVAVSALGSAVMICAMEHLGPER